MSEKHRAGNDDWDIVIGPRQGAVNLDLRGVWTYRNLIWMFFKRDFIAFYKQTILGPLWYVIQPTITSLTYVVVFGKIANISTGGISPFLFYFSGIILWNYFSACLTNNAEIFSKNASLFGKVYFPRLVVPISVVMSAMVALTIQFFLLLITALGFYFTNKEFVLKPAVLPLFPLLVAYVAVLGMSVGLIVSALTVRFRDLVFVVGFATQLWMYATPVVYPFSQIPQKYQWIYSLNPMTAPVETLRCILFDAPCVPWTIWAVNLAVTSTALVTGVVLFTRAESRAMDTV
jgi:lipopolysaccharide transport system permease protein